MTKTTEEVLKNNLIGTVVDGSRPVSEKDWEEGKEAGAHVPFLKAMEEYSSLQNRSLVELVAKQQLQIEEYKQMLEENYKIKYSLTGKFYNIGAPLNDNFLQFNKEQMKWCFGVVELAEQINALSYKEGERNG